MTRNGIDVTKEKINLCDDLIVEYDEDGKDHINALYETWFDIEKWLGVEGLEDDEWINLYTDWYPDTDEVTCTALIVKRETDDAIEVPLDDEEKKFFTDLMEDYCRKTCNVSLSELYRTAKEYDEVLEHG